MFARTLALVSKYRKALDAGPKQLPAPTDPESTDPPSSMTKTTLDLDAAAPTSAFDDLAASAPTVTLHATPDAAPAPNAPRKVIFATGGITNGRQAREVLDAGASVAQVYTALIYGGVGTISRIKREMREEAARQGTVTENGGGWGEVSGGEWRSNDNITVARSRQE
ncbi:hypothetical protein OPT61_g8080 [Boeremia exigua]|uniref:Uncharacterized protein n=1 Tax=Boeremia exigua TaxID=749465 RepID=A0ACC2HZR4_9PLEO|nr:hypothetical protein OPT61_g8080 [Boeremia exigua]